MDSELVAILEKESAAEIERILAEARAKAEEIAAGARRAAQEYRASAQARVESERKAARAKAHGAAQVKAAAQVLQAKDRALAEVFNRVEEELRRLQHDKSRYPAVLRALIREAASALSGRIIIEVHPDDRDLARSAVKELGLDADVATSGDISGGVRVSTADRRFVVENTLASRVQRVRPVLASEVAALLWGH